MDKSKAVFLDRDGTLIFDVGYPRNPKQVKILPGVTEVLKILSDQKYKLVIISNQSGIGRGILTLNEVEQINQHVVSILGKNGISIDAIYYCPHTPEEQCSCRKPSPEMLLQAAKDLNLDLGMSFMIGDKLSDIEAGKRAGCRTILLGDGVPDGWNKAPDFIANDWATISSYILNH